MKSSTHKVEEKFCDKFQQHKDVHIWFCCSCASRKINNTEVIFCALCRKQKYQSHKDHNPFYNCNTEKFKHKIAAFKNYIMNNQEDFIHSEDPNLHFVLQNNSISTKFNNTQFKKWLINTKFWEFNQANKAEQAKKNFKSFLKTESTNINNQNLNESQKIINWQKMNDENGVSIFDTMYKQAQQQKKKLIKQKTIIDLVFEAYSSFDTESRKEPVKKLDQILEQYPEECILYIIKLYLFDLHSENQDQWMSLLSKIQTLNVYLKQSPLCLFLQSFKYWKKAKQGDLSNSNDTMIKFVDPNTGSIYRLQSPKQYTELLSKAIIVQQNPPLILHAARGLGYLVQSKFAQAIRDFKASQSVEPQQSTQINEFYAQNKLSSQNNNVSQLLQCLENKSKHFIINAIKYLKKQNLPEKIIECCNLLCEQKNQNTFVLIEYTKALLKQGQVQKSDEIKSRIEKQKLDDSIKQRLNRKKLYAQARAAAKIKNLEACTEKCQILVGKKQSASALYTLASSYYNQQEYEQAEVYITKALSIKSSQKYKKLKLYIHMMKKQLDEAKKMLPSIKPETIDPKIREMLSQLS